MLTKTLVMWAGICGFVFSIFIHGISMYVLIHLKKTEYPNLWRKDVEESNFIMTAERRVLAELGLWKTPFWVERSRNGKFWMLLFRFSLVFAALGWFIIFLSVFIK